MTLTHTLRIAVPVLILFISAFASADYVGSGACKSCHQQPFERWQQSHHAAAMLPANTESVLGDFDQAVFPYAGKEHRFFKKNGKFMVYTDGADGRMQAFEIGYVFGFTPLQQYLVEMPDGRLQALNIAWDSRPKEEGGQRWYHLYPDSALTHEDSLHWTGFYHNWNSSCASCHSTNLKKRYDAKTDSFDTTWSEINVGCEACHGPGAKHVAWAKSGGPSQGDIAIQRLGDGGQWRFIDGKPIAQRQGSERPQTQIDTCASCHSFRSELTETIHAGVPHHQQHTLRLLDTPLYHADGQISDEVYVYGSFVQSKMHQQGVVCSDCHDAHSGQVKGGPENVCMQCHQASTYNTPEHHHHTSGKAGSFCVDCHMPETTYMGVDDRRDHSFRIPRPDFSEAYQVPNACSQCHSTKSLDWTTTAYEKWWGASRRGDAYTRAMALISKGDPRALDQILAVVSDIKQPAIKRATVLQNLNRYPSQAALQAAHKGLDSQDALIRRAAVNALAFVPVERRQRYLALLDDPSLSVRLAAVPFLAGIPFSMLTDSQNEKLGIGVSEYVDVYSKQADLPSVQHNLGNLYLALGAVAEAEAAFQQAIRIAPNFTPALLNLADLYRRQGDEAKAFGYLKHAAENADDPAAGAHALGLYYVRHQKIENAETWLRKATQLDAGNPRYAYVLAVALNGWGKSEDAKREVERALNASPYEKILKVLLKQLNQ